MRVLSVTLLSLVATIFLSSALLLALPGNFAVRALWITILVPVVWAGFMTYSYWDQKAWRTVTVLGAFSIAGIIIVILSPIPA